MTRIGFYLVSISLLIALILDKFFLIDILRRSNGQKPDFAEFFHMIFMGMLGKTHKELLIDAGIRPTTRDNCLHYLIVAMAWLTLFGMVLLVIGIMLKS